MTAVESSKILDIVIEALKKQEPQRVIQPVNEYICECPLLWMRCA